MVRVAGYLANFAQSGGLPEISWISKMLTLATIYDSGKATPVASDPIPDLSPTNPAQFASGKFKMMILRRGEIPRLSSPDCNRLMNACHRVSERCQTWRQIVNGHWYRFGHIQGQFTRPTPYMASQNFWQKPSSGPVESDAYTI